MKYSLECRLLGTEGCDKIIADERPLEFVSAVFRHLEDEHRDFLLDAYAKGGLTEMHRLLAERADRLP